jgi:hypothetical protein
MSAILLRHHTIYALICVWQLHLFVSAFLLCHTLYCLWGIIFCKKFMLFLSFTSISNVMLSQSFSSCMLVILLYVGHSMIYQPFSVFLQPFYVMSAILCYISYFIYFV